MAEEPKPLFCVYQAGRRSITCYRGVSNEPAQVADFLTFGDLATNFDWWDLPRAMGVSAWADPDKAAAMARRKGLPLVAEVDLSRAHEKTPWAFTGRQDHVTIWAPALVLIPAVIRYIRL